MAIKRGKEVCGDLRGAVGGVGNRVKGRRFDVDQARTTGKVRPGRTWCDWEGATVEGAKTR